MKKKAVWRVLILVVIALFAFTACQSSVEAPDTETEQSDVVDSGEDTTEMDESEEVSEDPAENEEESWTVALVLPGAINDGAFNAAAYNGVTALKDKFNLELEYSENVGLPDAERVMRAYGDRDFDIIISAGFGFSEPAQTVSADYPDAKFGVYQGYTESPNLKGLTFSNEQPGYLAGVVAAKLTKTGKVGGIGGDAVPSIIKMMEGFKLGAQSVDADIEVVITYAGTWTDPAAGYEAAIAQINQGVDVLFPVANATSNGVYQAGNEKDIPVVASEGDHCGESEAIYASALSHVDRVIEIMIEEINNDQFEGGVFYYGVAAGANDVLDCKLPEEASLALEEARAGIIDGSIVVPIITELSE